MLRLNLTYYVAVAPQEDSLQRPQGISYLTQPENIMVDFEGHMHLGDFGLCRINLEREEVAHSHCGSPEYMAY